MRSDLLRLRVVLVVLSLAAVVLLGACTSPSPRPQQQAGPSTAGFGIATDFTDMTPQQIDEALRDVRGAGLSWARVQFMWYRVQPNQGGAYDWSEYDRLVQQAKANNVRLIGMLSTTPSWARSPDCTATGGFEYACPPADVAGYAAFAAAAAARYAGDGVVWEVWNEPNLRSFWQPSPDPVAYTGLLVRTYDAIKRAAPGATVLSGGLSAALDPSQSTDPVQFLRAMYQAGAGGHFDGLGWHPYLTHGPGESPGRPGDANADGAWFEMYGTSESARSLMESNGDGGKKIWATEFGNSTYTQSYLSADENEQAQIMADAVRQWKSYDWSAVLCFYTYRDVAPYGSSDNSEAYFGLWRVDRQPKPAVAAIRSAIAEPGR